MLLFVVVDMDRISHRPVKFSLAFSTPKRRVQHPEAQSAPHISHGLLDLEQGGVEDPVRNALYVTP